MHYYFETDIGLKRSENQDRVIAGNLSAGAVYAVLCDGMGGENAGACASQITIDIVNRRLCEGFRATLSANSIRNLLVTAVTAANTLVYEKQKAEDDKRGMGTTCVAGILFEDRAYILNVGDSRAYHIWGDNMQQITKDHTEVQRLIDRGRITEKEGLNHPDRNCITRAVGAESIIVPDYFEFDLQDDSIILLCSDGLHAYGTDAAIADRIINTPIAKSARALVDYAIKRGGKDNVSVALLIN